MSVLRVVKRIVKSREETFKGTIIHEKHGGTGHCVIGQNPNKLKQKITYGRPAWDTFKTQNESGYYKYFLFYDLLSLLYYQRICHYCFPSKEKKIKYPRVCH